MTTLHRSRFLRGLLLAGVWWAVAGGAVASARGDDTVSHVVQAGDTIPRLCWRYKVRTAAILAANPGMGEKLAPGRRLVIPLGAYPAPRSGTAAAVADGKPRPRSLVIATATATTTRTTTTATVAVGRPASTTVRPVPLAPRLPPTTRLPPAPRETPRPAADPVTVVSVPLRDGSAP